MEFGQKKKILAAYKARKAGKDMPKPKKVAKGKKAKKDTGSPAPEHSKPEASA